MTSDWLLQIAKRSTNPSTMNAMARAFVIAVLCLSVVSARQLLAPVPAPAPSTSVYTVDNWYARPLRCVVASNQTTHNRPANESCFRRYDGAKIANATLPVGGTIVIPWKGRYEHRLLCH